MGYSGKDKRKRMEEAAKKIKESQQKIEEAAKPANTQVREGKHSLAGTRYLKGEEVRSFIPPKKKPKTTPETTQQKEARTRVPSTTSSKPLSQDEWHAKYRGGRVSQSSLQAYRGYLRGFGRK
ncbi:MAG: hypothetical protein ACYTBX_20175 [Planctomycetota bacterium]|jgi:hypothetical protein